MSCKRGKTVYIFTGRKSFHQYLLLTVLALCCLAAGIYAGLLRTVPEGRKTQKSQRQATDTAVSLSQFAATQWEPILHSSVLSENGLSDQEQAVPASSIDITSDNTSAALGPSGDTIKEADDCKIKLIFYTVEPGDNLSKIARKFNTTVNSIAAINGLVSPDHIAQGIELIVMKNASGTICIVDAGDTISEISSVYNIPMETIIAVNKLDDPENLVPGQLLLLPETKVNATNLRIAAASRSDSLIWPVTGKVTDGFGWRIHPTTGKKQFHEGIDIAAPLDTAIVAAASGTVTFTGWSDGYGRLVIISHTNGYRTRYGHLSRSIVSQGQKINKGDVLGYVGQSGRATGPHCHFEIEVSGECKNPRNYLP